MVYFIRAKSYFKYAKDLFKDLPNFINDPEKLKVKAKDIFKIALKAIWALSQVTSSDKKPDFEEIYKEALKSMDEFQARRIKEIKELLYSNESIKPQEVIDLIDETLKIVEQVLSPIL